MTTKQFRNIALSFPDTEERSHMHHPDFRVRGVIFATLGYPRRGWGVVKLTLGQRQGLVLANPGTFEPVPGAWGKSGATKIYLRTVRTKDVRKALAMAWNNVAPRSLADRVRIE